MFGPLGLSMCIYCSYVLICLVYEYIVINKIDISGRKNIIPSERSTKHLPTESRNLPSTSSSFLRGLSPMTCQILSAVG